MIQLAPAPGGDGSAEQAEPEVGEARQGFNHAAFQARLESLWFQRKALVANGREEEARAELEELHAFCTQEGIRRLEALAGALIAESVRFKQEGNHPAALASLDFAGRFDPDRPQTHMARASLLWDSGGGGLAAARELMLAARASVVRSFQHMSFFHRALVIVSLAWALLFSAFGILMLMRHQRALRHQIEEWAGQHLQGPWHEITGWVVLLLPLLIWVSVGWSIFYWTAATFRFMKRSERVATVTLLLVTACLLPIYGVAIGLYGTTADPAVRTTVTAVGGEYDPDRIMRLRELVASHPDDMVYRFLLGGLYKNGHYFEEAYAEYRAVLEHDPTLDAARINVGNIFYTTGQYAAAIKNYREVVEQEPASFLAHFNLHLAQSESFHFKEAEVSLQQARQIDASRVAQLLSAGGELGDRASVQDARLNMASVWNSAIGGRQLSLRETESSWVSVLLTRSPWLNGIAIACAAALIGCGLSGALFSEQRTARPCIRCGRAFCLRCKRGDDAHEYCSQCQHLYVLRDGLEPETKARKLFEVERHARRSHRLCILSSIILPGSGALLRGRTSSGLLWMSCWFLLVVTTLPGLFDDGGGSRVSLTQDLLASAAVPTMFDTHPGRFLALALIPMIWIAGNLSSQRSRES